MKIRTLALLATLSTLSLQAQTPSASVVGRATDAGSASVPGVSVTVTNLATNQNRVTRSNEAGDYTIPYLQPGRYSLEARREGFRLYRRTEFTVAVDQTLRLDFQLEIGTISESVTVTAQAPALNTENGTRGDVTANQELTEMPLAGRDFGDLGYLTAGVVPRAEGGDGTGYAVNGARPDNIGFLVDGMTNTHIRNTGSIVSPPLEGVQEFKMVTSGFSAEYGRFAGGLLSVVLKSGGNRLHGALSEFIRNDIFDARNFFDLDKSKLRRNQFGATVSGPVFIPKLYDGRNRTFFLMSWESLRQIAGGTRRGRVPLPGNLTGDFTGAIDAFGKPLAVVDFLARSAPFPGNRIPQNRLDPVAAKMAAFYPQPNLPDPANNYISQGNATNDWNSFTVKGDHAFSPRDQLSLRTVWRPNSTFDPFTRSFIPIFGSTNKTLSLLAGARYTRTFSPQVVGEFSASFSRRTNDWGWPDNTRDWSGDAGFVGGTKSPIALGLPQVEPTGYIILGHAFDLPKIWAYNNFQYAGTITWVKGAHTVKFGGDFLRYQYFSREYPDSRGRMTFLGRFSGEPLADFMLGYAQTTRRQLDASGPYHLISSYSTFIQDDFKITRTLTLNLGLRYELNKPPREKFGAWSTFLPSLGKVVMAGKGTLPDFDQRIKESSLANFTAMASDVGLPPTLVHPDYNDFAPRFGLAWRPFGGTNTVIRGGYGIFYGSATIHRLDNYNSGYPFAVAESYSAVSTNPLAVTVSNPYPAARRSLSGVTSTNGQDVDQSSQYLQSWNLTVEREFGQGNVIEIAYAGSKGTHLPRMFDLNQPFRELRLRAPNGTFPRPFPQFSTITYRIDGSNSSYNSGVATFRRRFSRELFVRASYTYAKSIDDTSIGSPKGGFTTAQDSRNLSQERGRSDYDLGHSFLASFIWQPAVGRNPILRNWQFSGTTRAYTGQAFTPKVANVALDLGDAVRPDRIKKGTVPFPSPDAWFDRTAFPTVPLGSYRFGNSGRNILDGPGAFNFDLGFSRRFRFTESIALQLRWETFNISNRANFNLPENNVDVLNGGTITSAKGARIHQLGLRLEF